MLILKIFFSLLFLSFFCLFFCFFFLIVNKKKLIDVLNKLGYYGLAKNLSIVYMPIKGSSISDQEKSNFTWKKIQNLETKDSFVNRIQFLLKAMNIIRIFIISLVCLGILSGIVYLVTITI